MIVDRITVTVASTITRGGYGSHVEFSASATLAESESRHAAMSDLCYSLSADLKDEVRRGLGLPPEGQS